MPKLRPQPHVFVGCDITDRLSASMPRFKSGLVASSEKTGDQCITCFYEHMRALAAEFEYVHEKATRGVILKQKMDDLADPSSHWETRPSKYMSKAMTKPSPNAVIASEDAPLKCMSFALDNGEHMLPYKLEDDHRQSTGLFGSMLKVEVVDPGGDTSTEPVFVPQESCRAGRLPLENVKQRICREAKHLRDSNDSTMTFKSIKRERQRIWLDIVPACIIALNTISMGVSADNFPDHIIWWYLEATWVMCYTIEFVSKCLLYGLHDYFLGEDKYWNWFDFAMLNLSWFDQLITWVVSDFEVLPGNSEGLLKVFRFVRLGRIVRMLHYKIFDELKAMILGVIAGVKVLAWAIVLLLLTVYIFGLALNNVWGEGIPEFSTVLGSMLTVFRCYTDGCSRFDGTPLATHLYASHGGVVFFVVYILSFMLVTVGIFNLIMAIFIDNVSKASMKRKLQDIGESAMQIKGLTKHIIFRLSDPGNAGLDIDDLKVTRHMFNEWLRDTEFTNLMDKADIDTASKAELFDVLDVDMGGELEYDELIDGLMLMRGPITKSDIVAVRLKARYLTTMVEDVWQQVAILTGCDSKAEIRKTFNGNVDRGADYSF